MADGRHTWTDERLDDLADRITRFEGRMDARLREIDGTLQRIQRSMIGIQRSMILTVGTFLTVFGGILAATHL